jgi:hypothetical protein
MEIQIREMRQYGPLHILVGQHSNKFQRFVHFVIKAPNLADMYFNILEIFLDIWPSQILPRRAMAAIVQNGRWFMTFIVQNQCCGIFGWLNLFAYKYIICLYIWTMVAFYTLLTSIFCTVSCCEKIDMVFALGSKCSAWESHQRHDGSFLWKYNIIPSALV